MKSTKGASSVVAECRPPPFTPRTALAPVLASSPASGSRPGPELGPGLVPAAAASPAAPVPAPEAGRLSCSCPGVRPHTPCSTAAIAARTWSAPPIVASRIRKMTEASFHQMAAAARGERR
eukprot:3188098-Pleurochrysis_carterae.AAC.3